MSSKRTSGRRSTRATHLLMFWLISAASKILTFLEGQGRYLLKKQRNVVPFLANRGHRQLLASHRLQVSQPPTTIGYAATAVGCLPTGVGSRSCIIAALMLLISGKEKVPCSLVHCGFGCRCISNRH